MKPNVPDANTIVELGVNGEVSDYRSLARTTIALPNGSDETIEVAALQSSNAWTGYVAVRRGDHEPKSYPVLIGYELADAVGKCALRLLDAHSEIPMPDGIVAEEYVHRADDKPSEVYTVQIIVNCGRRSLVIESEMDRVDVPYEIGREVARAIISMADAVDLALAVGFGSWIMLTPQMSTLFS